MWLVPRNTDGIKNRREVPQLLQAALKRWYTGTGDEADHRASVSLVVTARENEQWIACSCLEHDDSPPLISPAYLSEAETYYLRRLTSRPHHHRRCTYYLPQAPDRIREKIGNSLFEIDRPKGLFNAHKQAPEKLATQPDETEQDDRSRGVAIPRLGKLMWMLLEAAHTNVLREPDYERENPPALKREFARLSKAAERFAIAPGIRLSDHLYFTAKDYDSLRIHARLREAARKWPDGNAPQAFLLLEANAISGTTVHTGLGDLEIRNRIQHTGIIRAEVQPPFLVLAVVGEHSRKEGYRALRAYAQPVFKGNRFIPVEREIDRELLGELLAFQRRMRGKTVQVAVKKPLFNFPTSAGAIRPDLIVAFLDHRTGLEADFAIQILASADPHYLEMKQAERAQLLEVHPTLTVRADLVGTDRFQNHLEAMIENA